MGPDNKPIPHQFEWTMNHAKRARDKMMSQNFADSGLGSNSNNDLYNNDKKSYILGGTNKQKRPDPDGGSSGFNNYVKNNCGVSGISGHASQKSGGGHSANNQKINGAVANQMMID